MTNNRKQLYMLSTFVFGVCITACSKILNTLINNGQVTLPRDSEYATLFLEPTYNSTVYQPFNAYSSIVYYIVFLVHSHSDYVLKTLVAWINLLLSVASFLYHSTKIEIIGDIDLSIVIINTIGMLFLQTKFNTCMSVLIVCVGLLILVADSCVKYGSPDEKLINKYKYPLIAVSSFGILFTTNGLRFPYLLYVLGYVFKIIELVLLSNHLDSKFHGTWLYHLLTGSAILLKLYESLDG